MYIYLSISLIISLSITNLGIAKGGVSFANNVVVAHRGAWKQQNLPENSIAALEHAIVLKCAGSEFDVRMTKDDVLIVNHDADYHDLNIEEHDYGVLARFQAFEWRKNAYVSELYTSWYKIIIMQLDWFVKSSPRNQKYVAS
jgi:glycerophosphoryl diester phosphodiesterase